MPEAESPLYSEDAETRNEAFAEAKASGEQMVHRLRDWEEGQTIWGYEVRTEGGGSMGKTHTRDDFSIGKPDEVTDEMEFKSHIVDSMYAMLGEGGGDDRRVGFAWVAEIDRVRTEGRDPMDPGEPPLKFAVLRNVSVVESEVR